MKKGCQFILIMLFSVTIIFGCVEESVDQEQLRHTDSYYICGNEVAQTFVPSVSGILTKVSVNLIKYNGMTQDYQNIVPGDLQVEIQSTENDPAIPSGETLASMIINESSIPNSEHYWLFVSFDSPLFLEKGKSYAIVVKQLFMFDSNTSVLPLYGWSIDRSTDPSEDPYGFGNIMERKYDTHEWLISGSSYEDAVFETYMLNSSDF